MRLIDADALIKRRQFIVAEAEGMCGDVVWVRDIQGAPTIDHVERGEWAYREIRDYPIAIDRVGCTNCGWRFYSHPDEKDTEHRADYIAGNYMFCPMCGNKLRRSSVGRAVVL